MPLQNTALSPRSLPPRRCYPFQKLQLQPRRRQFCHLMEGLSRNFDHLQIQIMAYHALYLAPRQVLGALYPLSQSLKKSKQPSTQYGNKSWIPSWSIVKPSSGPPWTPSRQPFRSSPWFGWPRISLLKFKSATALLRKLMYLVWACKCGLCFKREWRSTLRASRNLQKVPVPDISAGHQQQQIRW